MSARTVLVTGASAGIGLELSRVFAERGYRVVLVARRAERLEQLAHELRSQGALAETLVADLADPNAPEEMFRETQRRGIDIDILVNNAGYGEEPFGATAWADQARFLQVMLVSLCHLTHLYLPGMKQRGYGRVLNVASLAAFAPVRAGDLYAPIKTFVVRFTQAIDDELVRGEVDVRCVASCPGFTRTEFHDVMGIRDTVDAIPGFMWQTARAVAEEAFDACVEGRTVYVHGFVNRVFAFLMPRMPVWAVRLLSPKGSLDRWAAER